ncbi:hypothetical protein F4680DRAFT_413086 [Xylaria scruposa]|nr:hypothetical protein F4680DRAFT_413086 [Xylaria scruposa]
MPKSSLAGLLSWLAPAVTIISDLTGSVLKAERVRSPSPLINSSLRLPVTGNQRCHKCHLPIIQSALIGPQPDTLTWYPIVVLSRYQHI